MTDSINTKMAAGGRVVRASTYAHESNRQPFTNTPDSGMDSWSISHHQLPDSVTPFRATSSLSSTVPIIPTKTQAHPSTALADCTKPPSRPAAALSKDRPPPARTRQRRRQSPAKLATINVRCHTRDSNQKEGLDDLVTGGFVNTGRVISAACKDRLAKVVQKQAETPEVQVRRPKSTNKQNILRQLNLEEFPTYWYTTVVPATDVYLHRQSSSVRGPGVGVSVQSRPQTVTSRLLCNVSPTMTSRSRLSDISHIAKPAQHDILYDATLQRRRETCREMEELLRRKVEAFLASLEDSVEFKPRPSM